MDRPAWVPEGIDVDKPSASRMYDYYLGGCHNFAADREVAERAIAVMPEGPLLAQMTSTGKYDYGFAIYAKRFGGRRWLGHDGSYGGYESEQWHSGDVTITILTNLEESDNADDTTSDQIWNAVARAYDRGQ